jgi:hypothetical protein
VLRQLPRKASRGKRIRTQNPCCVKTSTLRNLLKLNATDRTVCDTFHKKFGLIGPLMDPRRPYRFAGPSEVQKSPRAHRARTTGIYPITDRASRCLVLAIDGAFLSRDWKEALWGKFYTGAPLRQRRSVERYNIVKRA